MILLRIINVKFRRNRSSADQIFCIRQIMEKSREYNRKYISYLQTSRRPTIRLLGGSIIQYSHRVWDTHESSQAD
jgi:hypothetical protein